MTGETIDMRGANRVRLSEIFVAFFRLGVVSFGGGTAGWLYREIVDRRRWINDAEFLSGAALGRLMPGSGGVNLTVQVGQHLHGGSGALAAVVGLLSGPLAIISALAAGYTRIDQNMTLHAVLDGVAAAAIGLTFATGLKLVRFRRAERRASRRHRCDRALRRGAALADDTGCPLSRSGQHRAGAL